MLFHNFQNHYGIIEFNDAGVVQSVLSLANHRLNSQNLIVKPRDVQVWFSFCCKIFFGQTMKYELADVSKTGV